VGLLEGTDVALPTGDGRLGLALDSDLETPASTVLSAPQLQHPTMNSNIERNILGFK